MRLKEDSPGDCAGESAFGSFLISEPASFCTEIRRSGEVAHHPNG